MNAALDLLILSVGWLHVFLSPYTKVEESFNLHAIHDVLMYGVGPASLHKYDHFEFPGVVPRSFIGSVTLSWLLLPLLSLARSLGVSIDKFDLQLSARLMLSAINAFGLCLLRRGVSRQFGFMTGAMFAIITSSQFHLLYWMGRTLPNMFALLPVNIAMYWLINPAKDSRRFHYAAIALLTFAAVVLRAELLLLLAPLALQMVFLRPTTFWSITLVGLASAIFSVALTVLVDSYFWNQFPLWPEFVGLYFNVYQGKSADWGVSPAHAYLTQHLPKLLLGAAPLAALGAAIDPRVRYMLIPSTAFVSIISCLGHKEWRFVIYVVPIANVAAARGASWTLNFRRHTLLHRFLALTIAGLVAANVVATGFLTVVSRSNYPGGHALRLLNKIVPPDTSVHVHIDNLAAQTGASLFLHEHSPPNRFRASVRDPTHGQNWIYNKSETITEFAGFTHLITESWKPLSASGEWETLAEVDGFSGVRLRPFPEVIVRPQLGILERRTFLPTSP